VIAHAAGSGDDVSERCRIADALILGAIVDERDLCADRQVVDRSQVHPGQSRGWILNATVRALLTVKDINTPSPEQAIVAEAAEQPIHARPADEEIIASSTAQRVLARASEQDVVATETKDEVVSSAPADHVTT